MFLLFTISICYSDSGDGKILQFALFALPPFVLSCCTTASENNPIFFFAPKILSANDTFDPFESLQVTFSTILCKKVLKREKSGKILSEN